MPIDPRQRAAPTTSSRAWRSTPATSGAGTHLALTYYFYPDANCGGGCRLDVGYISSPDGGAHWGDRDAALPGRWRSARSRHTSQGPMTGDYISTSFSGGMATTLFAVGRDAHAAAFDDRSRDQTNRGPFRKDEYPD